MPLPGGYLLATNLVLALVRGNPFGRYLDASYGFTQGLNPFLVSIVTVGEMFALVEKFKAQGQPWGPKKVKSLNERHGGTGPGDTNSGLVMSLLVIARQVRKRCWILSNRPTNSQIAGMASRNKNG